MPADRAWWKTYGSVGMMRIHWPVTNSRITKTTPLSSHRPSRAWCIQMVIEYFFGVLPLAENSESLRGVKFAGGRCSERICRPVLMISTMRNMLRKCCQPSQAGMPVGADSG